MEAARLDGGDLGDERCCAGGGGHGIAMVAQALNDRPPGFAEAGRVVAPAGMGNPPTEAAGQDKHLTRLDVLRFPLIVLIVYLHATGFTANFADGTRALGGIPQRDARIRVS